MDQDCQAHYDKTIEEMRFFPRAKIIVFNVAITRTAGNRTQHQMEEAHQRAQQQSALQKKKIQDEKL